MGHVPCTFFFFFNDTATTEIYTLSLHDALPISQGGDVEPGLCGDGPDSVRRGRLVRPLQDPIDVDDPALPNRRERVREVVERRMREVEDDAVDRRDFLEDTAGSGLPRGGLVRSAAGAARAAG